MAFTDDQQKAIDFCDGNLLVSAAAGSGKTSVLVERIVKRITDKENPVSVDSIVVVTFTKAAAAEMKKRLSDRLQKMADDEPDNRYLIKQLALLDNAKITTIDSFCSYIISNYYNSISIDPRFRIADEGEMKLIAADVISDIFEQHFSKNDKSFIRLVDCYASGKKLDGLADMIKKLEAFAQSHPWPDEWLSECENVYEADSGEKYEKLPAVQNIVEYVRRILSEYAHICDRLIEMCKEPDGPRMYIAALSDDRENMIKAANSDSFLELAEKIDWQWARLASSKGADKDLSSLVKEIRDEYKAKINDIRKKYFENASEQYKMMGKCHEYITTIIGLTREFISQKSKLKQSKNILDFNDIEHYALEILINRDDDGNISYTRAADELSEKFSEIYIDEYQDSNMVQEYILGAVSRERFGHPDTFMVGDVKQSIYSFRMAQPRLFTDKYDKYGDSGDYVKIELHKNFRSHANVLNCVNDVFFQAMKKEIGGVMYTDDVKLNYGGEFKDTEIDDTTEIIIVSKENLTDDEYENSEVCALAAVKKIKDMMSENISLRYNDFVILLRSAKKSGPLYVTALEKNGIPAVYDSSTGYFDAYEVQIVIDMLRVIDNPRQEIPLAAVMHSYFACFDAEDMAGVKGEDRNEELWDCLRNKTQSDDECGKKSRHLVNLIEEYRKKASLVNVSELVSDIIFNTGFYDYAGNSRNGSKKQGNLKMLIERAKDYEKTSFCGLFNFIRYIEKLRKYEADFGESRTTLSGNDAVRIMSIHQSKGLEFPIVIIGDMNHGFNEQQLKERLVYNGDFGLGITYIDHDRRTAARVPYKDMISTKIHNDMIGEELRILYVAMTRAEKKLILIGTAEQKYTDKIKNRASVVEELTTAYVSGCHSFMDIILPVAAGKNNSGNFSVLEMNAADILDLAGQTARGRVNSLRDRLQSLSSAHIDKDTYEELCRKFGYSYPYDNVTTLRAKYSVSDLKMKAMEENDDLSAKVCEPERIKRIPRFMEDKEQTSGTFRGTAYHKVFELIDYADFDNEDDVRRQIEDFVRKGTMNEESAKLINCQKFVNFIRTDLGQAMKRAFQNNLLFREQPFMMEVSADKLDSSYPETEGVLVQGIIDAFYIEENYVYVVDYKTDSVTCDPDGEKILTERYRKQLELYCDAIKQVTGRQIGGCYIYSVCLDKKIEIPV